MIKIKILLISLFLYVNCHGSSKTVALGQSCNDSSAQAAGAGALNPANLKLAQVATQADSDKRTQAADDQSEFARKAIDLARKVGASSASAGKQMGSISDTLTCSAKRCFKLNQPMSELLKEQSQIVHNNLSLPHELRGIIEEHLHCVPYKCISTLENHNIAIILDTIQLRDGKLATCAFKLDENQELFFELRIWDLNTGRHVSKQNHERFMTKVVQLPDDRLATISLGGENNFSIQIWNFNQGNNPNIALVDEIDLGTQKIIDLIPLTDGRLASVFTDGTIRIWDLTRPADQRCVATLTGHTQAVYCVIQLADGRLATASADETIRIWDLTRPQDQRCVAVLTDYMDQVCSIIQLKDGKLASASNDNKIRIWDLTKPKGNDPKSDQRCVNKFNLLDDFKHFRSHMGQLTQLLNGSLALSCNQKVYIWKLNLQGVYECIDILDDCILLTDRAIRNMTLVAKYNGLAAKIIQLADGRLASSSYDAKIRIWDNKKVEKLDIKPLSKPSKPFILKIILNLFGTPPKLEIVG